MLCQPVAGGRASRPFQSGLRNPERRIWPPRRVLVPAERAATRPPLGRAEAYPALSEPRASLRAWGETHSGGKRRSSSILPRKPKRVRICSELALGETLVTWITSVPLLEAIALPPARALQAHRGDPGHGPWRRGWRPLPGIPQRFPSKSRNQEKGVRSSSLAPARAPQPPTSDRSAASLPGPQYPTILSGLPRACLHLFNRRKKSTSG